MSFSSGQIIVHPVHGPMNVREIKTRTVRGEAVEYLELERISGDLHISVPASKASDIGLRALLAKAQIEELLTLLRTPGGPVEKQWSRRIKAFQERISLGTPEAKASVFRDVVSSSGLSPHAGAERDILRDVRASLGTEFALSLGVEQAAAEAMLDEAAAEGSGVLENSPAS